MKQNSLYFFLNAELHRLLRRCIRYVETTEILLSHLVTPVYLLYTAEPIRPSTGAAAAGSRVRTPLRRLLALLVKVVITQIH